MIGCVRAPGKNVAGLTDWEVCELKGLLESHFY